MGKLERGGREKVSSGIVQLQAGKGEGSSRIMQQTVHYVCVYVCGTACRHAMQLNYAYAAWCQTATQPEPEPEPEAEPTDVVLALGRGIF